MCGILGHIPSSEQQLFQLSLDRLQHRGPDGYGTWSDSNNRVTLGHRRLAIIDLSENGKQPMEWNGRYVITFNGEIYNYVELRKQLEQRGIQFKTQSDTEVLLALYATEGAGCLHKLNGMWAFAIYDKEDDSIFLSRDRMGEKPLFYMQHNNVFAFGSEMKALYSFLPTVEPDLHVLETAKNNMFTYEATDQCLIRGIKRFPAASFGVYKNGNLQITTYWEPLDDRITMPRDYNQQVEMFRELFIDSCKLRMRSDVPVGTALSGGIDSSATISAMAYVSKHLKGVYSRDWQHAFVASFPGSVLDETAEAKKVAEYLNIEATYLMIDPLKDIDKLFYYSYLFEEFYIASPIPFIQLYGEIKRNGTTVTLDGHGSDELFGGYGNDIGFKTLDDYPNPFKMRRTLQTVSDTKHEQNKISYGRVYLESKNILLGRNRNANKDHSNNRMQNLDHLNRQLYDSTFKTVLPTLLRNYDRYSMINGVEIRMPFLDHRIVSLAFSIPGSSKVRNGFSKSMVRDAMKGFFPDDIRLLKRKIGFHNPFTEWMKGPLREWLLDQMESQSFRSATFIEPQAVKKNILKVMNDSASSFSDGEAAWESLMPYVWEKSLQYAK